jgi:hypothetical protein
LNNGCASTVSPTHAGPTTRILNTGGDTRQALT